MRRAAIAAAVLLLAATAAWADYGEWTQPYVISGNYNNALLGVDASDADNVFMVGVWTDNISSFKFIWRTTDGGGWVENIYSWTMSSDPGEMCEMLHITDARTSVAATTSTHALFGGSGVSQECIDSYGPDPGQQMICFIACAMTIGPSIWYTEDGGDTFHEASIPKVLGASIQSIYMVDDNVGYAAGLGGYVIKTADGGLTWEKTAKLPGDGGEYGYYVNNVWCVDQDKCWLAVGEWDPDAAKSQPQGLDYAKQHLHQMMMSSNPVYRRNYWDEQGAKGPKMLNGRIFRTTDGGDTWELQLTSATEGYSGLQMVDANNGWMVGETYNPNGDTVTAYNTTDGGANWNDVTNRLPATIQGTQGWSPSGFRFVNPGFGFAFGVGSKMLGYTPALVYTEDGGDTWTPDTAAISFQGGQFDLVFVNPSVAYSVGLYLNLMKYQGTNAAPTADAGDDFSTAVNAQAALDGTGSSDPDGGGLFYTWTQVSGDSVELSDPTVAQPTFTPTAVGELVFQLVVSDGELSSAPDTVTVTVTETPVDDDTDDDATDDDATDDDAADDDDNGDDDDDDSGCGC